MRVLFWFWRGCKAVATLAWRAMKGTVGTVDRVARATVDAIVNVGRILVRRSVHVLYHVGGKRLLKKTIRLASDNALMKKIKETLNWTHEWCGRMVRYAVAGIWHYGVALSNKWMLSWGDGGKVGGFVVHVMPANCERVEDNCHSRETFLAKIQAAIAAFNQTWEYDLLRWNCEHVARLITKEKALSHQAGRTQNREAEGELKAALST